MFYNILNNLRCIFFRHRNMQPLRHRLIVRQEVCSCSLLKCCTEIQYRIFPCTCTYHILPLLIVLGIGILSFVVWIVWGICVCQKCKCCVCKGPKCKTPSIVLALIFYVIVLLISFYSLVERNKVFTGLADLECSILKFTDEVLEGENSPYPPYWAGIDNMRGILGQITGNISELKPNTENELLALKDDVNN